MPKAVIHKHGGPGQTVTIFCPACQTIHSINHDNVYGWTFNEDTERPTIGGSIGFHGEDSGGVYCHSHVKDGKIEFYGDSAHAFAGQTLDLPEVPEIYQ